MLAFSFVGPPASFAASAMSTRPSLRSFRKAQEVFAAGPVVATWFSPGVALVRAIEGPEVSIRTKPKARTMTIWSYQ